MLIGIQIYLKGTSQGSLFHFQKQINTPYTYIMDIQIYLNQLTNLLKQEIISKDFVNSGSLLDSVNFTSEVTAQGLSIQLEANDYIKYLDNGMFMEDFFNNPQVEQIIEEAVTAWVESQLENI